MKQNRSWMKYPAILVVTLFIFNVFTPLAEAKGPRSGKTVSHDELMTIHPSAAINWNTQLNLANGSDYKLLDYNLTWKPFLDNHTAINGAIIHSAFAPILFSLNTTNQSISTGSFFSVTPEQIMDGISQVWFRVPLLDIPVNASIRLRISKILSYTDFNISFYAFGQFLSTGHSPMILVYDLTIDPLASGIGGGSFDWALPNCWANHRAWQNITVPNTNNTLHYNFTYVKTNVELFPNEWYYVEFDIMTHAASQMKIAVSPSDFGDDGQYQTWMWLNGTNYYFSFDLDTSFIATYGTSNGITGIGLDVGQAPPEAVGQIFSINASIPIGIQINTAITPWFEVVVPFMLNLTSSPPVRSYCALSADITFYSSSDDSIPFHVTHTGVMNATARYNFFLNTTDLTGHNGVYLNHIRIVFVVLNGGVQAEMIRFWGGQSSFILGWQVGHTDLYWGGGGANYTMYEKEWVIPYGYYSLSKTHWTMTNQTIVVIPVNITEVHLSISEIITKFEAYLKMRDDDGNLMSAIHKAVTAIGEGLKWLSNEFIKSFMKGWQAFYNLIPGLEAFAKQVLNILKAAFKVFGGIAVWIWKIINIVFDALEWFTYWAVRMIYSFSIAIVYIINVFGVISINSALLAVARTGNGKDFVKAFRAGWKFVFAIISLLLSLAIMAISIVGAVVPF